MAANGPFLKSKTFVRTNGWYVFFCELGRRIGILFRRRMLARWLGPSVSLGPRCYVRGLCHMSIGEGFSAAEGLWLEAVTFHAGQRFTPAIVIGKNVTISRWSHITSVHRVSIGDGVLVGSKVIIADHNHGEYSGPYTNPLISPNQRPLGVTEDVVIEANVWLGDGVVVCPGSRIGQGSIIGANAVVTGTIPPFTIAAGTPARPLKTYDFDRNEWVKAQ
jgi:lipopolysaccharide O-acetyltransferase